MLAVDGVRSEAEPSVAVGTLARESVVEAVRRADHIERVRLHSRESSVYVYAYVDHVRVHVLHARSVAMAD